MTENVGNCLNTNCRDPGILREIKQKLESEWAKNPRKIQVLDSVKASLQAEQFVCEYVTEKSIVQEEGSTGETGIPTYLRATLTSSTGAANDCIYNVKDVIEYDPQDIDFILDTKKIEEVPYKNGQPINLPILYYYDGNKPNINSKINQIAMRFPS